MISNSVLKAGDVVEITRAATQIGKAPVTYRSELVADPTTSSTLNDVLGLKVKNTWGYVDGINDVKMIEKAIEKHYFYRNVNRAPVIGDIYLNLDGAPSVIRGDLSTSAGFINSGTLSWALSRNKMTNDRSVRTLIWDNVKKKVVESNNSIDIDTDW